MLAQRRARKKKAPAGVGPRRGTGGVTDAVVCVLRDGVTDAVVCVVKDGVAARTRRRGVRALLLPVMARPPTRPTGRRGRTSRGGDGS
ncbi:hypothetical protein ACIBQ6_06675 [Nonomuraea sp. NPDC049655]|uniref:hypothetical protein n=1 Tax=Nonomuraea sp. NPDC049655 TaxID=3364355 RepID=UPI0037953AA3